MDSQKKGTHPVIDIEICSGCKSHQWCTRHDEKKYQSIFEDVKKAIQAKDSAVDIRKHLVGGSKMGAFEISSEGRLLYSKLSSGYFPFSTPVAEKIGNFVRDFREGKDTIGYDINSEQARLRRSTEKYYDTHHKQNQERSPKREYQVQKHKTDEKKKVDEVQESEQKEKTQQKHSHVKDKSSFKTPYETKSTKQERKESVPNDTHNGHAQHDSRKEEKVKEEEEEKEEKKEKPLESPLKAHPEAAVPEKRQSLRSEKKEQVHEADHKKQEKNDEHVKQPPASPSKVNQPRERVVSKEDSQHYQSDPKQEAQQRIEEQPQYLPSNSQQMQYTNQKEVEGESHRPVIEIKEEDKYHPDTELVSEDQEKHKLPDNKEINRDLTSREEVDKTGGASGLAPST